MRLHAGGPSNQKRAISVCSAVRACADLAADALDLVVVARVGLAGQRRGTGEPELRGGEQREGRDIAPAGEERGGITGGQLLVRDGRIRRVGVRMRPPLARARCPAYRARPWWRRRPCGAPAWPRRPHGLPPHPWFSRRRRTRGSATPCRRPRPWPSAAIFWAGVPKLGSTPTKTVWAAAATAASGEAPASPGPSK